MQVRYYLLENRWMMKAKFLVRYTIALVLVITCIYFLERNRQTRLTYIANENTCSKPVKEIKESINEFIFIEAISKYLFVSISK